MKYDVKMHAFEWTSCYLLSCWFVCNWRTVAASALVFNVMYAVLSEVQNNCSMRVLMLNFHASYFVAEMDTDCAFNTGYHPLLLWLSRCFYQLVLCFGLVIFTRCVSRIGKGDNIICTL